MLTDLELASMRDTTTSALPDTGTIHRPAARTAGTLDPITGTVTAAAATSVYTGALRVGTPNALEQEAVFGDIEVTTQPFIVTLPHDAPLVKIDDRIAITTASDPTLTDLNLRVMAVAAGSYHVTRRVGAEVVQ